jgi:hypothetical protein
MRVIMTWSGHVAYSGEMRNAKKILAGKPEGDGDIDERTIRILVVSETVDWTECAQDNAQ